MNIEEMKKDIDGFIRELFNGTTILITTKGLDEKTSRALNEAFKTLDQYKDHQFVKEFNEGLYPQVLKYLDGNIDDDFVRKMYRIIIMARNYGLIINNTDAIATLKLEKMYAEDKSRKFENDNKLLSEEVVHLRGVIDSVRAKNPISG